jgi:hypothetical protein
MPKKPYKRRAVDRISAGITILLDNGYPSVPSLLRRIANELENQQIEDLKSETRTAKILVLDNYRKK